MPKDLTSLALETFGGVAGDDEQERVNYYRQLTQREKAGEELDDDDRNWLAQARQNLSGSDRKSADDLALKEFSKRKPLDLELGPVKVLRANPPDLDLEIGPAKITKPDLEIGEARIQSMNPAGRGASRTEHLAGMLNQNMESATRGGFPGTFNQGMRRGVSHEFQPSVGDMLQAERTVKPEFRTLDRRPSDVSMQDTDKFGSDQLERMYGPHLKAAEEQFSYGQKDDFPDGYFDGMSKETEKNIRAGVKELKSRKRLIRT